MILESFWRSEPAAALRGLAKASLALGLQPAIQPFEGVVAHEDLAANLQELQVAREPSRRSGIVRTVFRFCVTSSPSRPSPRVAPADEPPPFVEQGDTQAVHLGFAHVVERFAGEGADETRLELADLVGGIGVVQAEHGSPVPDRGEALRHGPADALGGGVGRDEIRMGVLQRLQFAEEAIVLGVCDLRPILHVVAVAVVVEQRAQLFGADGDGFFRGHGGLLASLVPERGSLDKPGAT